MIDEAVRVATYFSPVFFMLLYSIKTAKLNFLYNYLALFPVSLSFIMLSFSNFGYPYDLILFYFTATVFLTQTLGEKHHISFLQSLSLAFNITFFSSAFWEIPIHIYTIIARGGIDGAFPLHLLYFFPLVFIIPKFKFKKQTIKYLLISLAISTIILSLHIYLNLDIFYPETIPPAQNRIIQLTWMLNRLTTIILLSQFFTKNEMRKNV